MTSHNCLTWTARRSAGIAVERSPLWSWAISWIVSEHALLLQQLKAGLLTSCVETFQVLLSRTLAKLALELEVPIPACHLRIHLAIGLALEAGLGTLPLLHDVPGMRQGLCLFLNAPRIPKLIPVQLA